jgi:GT2 family glycosyltransferase
MKLSIIIVNYNVQYFLENCLSSVFKAADGISLEVIVVDNNSVDGSIRMLQEKFPQVKLIANKDNKGFSKANNQAIKQAKGEFVLLLNPDTVIEENTLSTCIRFFEEHQDAGGLGIKMVDGKGNFLPESKRGLPTPSVAFYKIFGLSALFPRSEKFGQYHLGHLSKDENHEVEILSGAFMMIRKKVLDQIGLLDESFFMYGEDIDLSYRITQAGYKNYYLADTSIIHYKGESTKKSSINYVFVFYRAMAIFARKHFSDKNARLFSGLINLAIYLRASLAVLTRTVKQFLLPFLDGLLIYTGVSTFKNYYEDNIKFIDGGSFPEEVELYGIPIIVGIYLIAQFFNGGYYMPTRFKSIINGIFSGSLLLLITYSLLNEGYRFSRAIILFTVCWAFVVIPLYRYLLHLTKIRQFRKNEAQRLALVGGKEELQRINSFLKNTLIQPEKIIYVDAGNSNDNKFPYAGKLYQLADIIEIYDINEVIFCAKDLKSAEIIEQMSSIQNKKVDFKIAPAESLYIIGSNTIEDSGEYYIIGSDALLKPVNQRNKRVLDICLSLFFILLSPLFIWFCKRKTKYFGNLQKVLSGKVSFVGFDLRFSLPEEKLKVKRGILTATQNYQEEMLDESVIEKVNFEYGRNYHIWKDIELIFRNLAALGNKKSGS